MAHRPTDYIRGRVAGLAQAGLPQQKIADVLGLTLHALRKNYKHELDELMANRVAEVANRLFMQATSDKDTQANTIARLFIMKCQAHWKEVHAVEMSGPDGQPLQAPPTLQIVLPSNLRNDDLAHKLGTLRSAAPSLQLEHEAVPIGRK